MALNKNETRITLTLEEIAFLIERIEGYRRAPAHNSVWEKMWSAHNRVYRKAVKIRLDTEAD